MIRQSLDPEEKTRIFSDVKTGKKLMIKETVSDKAEAVAIGKMIEKLVGGTSFFSMDTGRAGLDVQKEYSFADFAILCRTRQQCRTFIKVFENEGIPLETADKNQVFNTKGICHLISLLRIMTHCESFLDIQRIFQYFGIRAGKDKMALWYQTACAGSRDILASLEQAGVRGLKRTSAKKWGAIAGNLIALRRKIENCDNETAIEILWQKTGLKDIIEDKDKIQVELDKLLSRARLYDDLKGFLDGLALNRDADAIGADMEKVSLMTLHAAKGLEFPVVFVSGCEQGLVPFAKDGKHIDDLEEERRLFYVAMTRAMDILCLTYAKKRSIYGKNCKRQRSSFIEDIEKRLTQLEKSSVRLPVKKKETQLELF